MKKKKQHRIFKPFILLFILISFIEFRPSNKLVLEDTLPFAEVLSRQENKKPIVVVGDLQKTSIWEIALGRESNDEERVLLVDEISKDDPALMVVLGDMVFDGSDAAQWREFGKLLQPVRQKNIPVYPVLGNHEYWGSNISAKNNFTKFFPQLAIKSWYIQKYDSLALVFLDSNDSDLSAREWNEQKKWYEQKMKEFDLDASIKGVLVFLHHPPYTNSLITGDEVHVQLAFVPAYLKSKKALAMFSGHAHTYEKFQKDEKIFIVSGGGGGPRVALNKGKNFHNDLYSGKSPRPFHYLLLNRDGNELKVTVRGLLKGTSLFFTMEEFYLPIKG